MKYFLLPLLLLTVIIAGCGKQYPTPSKQVTDTATIPPTQRPYKIKGRTYYPLPDSHGYKEKGIASWYGRKFHGRKTSNGEVYNMYGKTAAHKTLPMNTYVLVKNLENGREMVVRINDRGPFVKGRIIDLSLTGAQELGIVKNGTARVQLTALGEAMTYGKGAKKVERFLPHQDFQQGDFYVQIGSFTNKDNAVRLKEKMARQGKKVDITTFDRGDSLFYRVQVAGGSTLTAARAMEKQMGVTGYPDAFVVAR